jgi:1-acyl-sn-glycerol-3-phosphate acyltransferase
MSVFCLFLLKLFGWKLVIQNPVPSRCVIIFAPHTSNWDFVWMLVTKFAMKLKLNYLGKHTLFKGPWAFFFRMTGGIPVLRSKTNNMVEGLVTEFEQRESMRLAVAPEGTRSKTNHWKSGFYHIAVQAQVPIVCAFMDMKTRSLGIGEVFQPTGDQEQDLDIMRKFYSTIEGKIPSFTSDIKFKTR